MAWRKETKLSTNDTVFLDESGNTGSDLANPEQPIFAFAAIGVDGGQFTRIETGISRLKKKWVIPERQELKGAAILKGRRRPIVKEVLELLLKDAVLFVEIVEKRFAICTYLVDDLFDPVYNEKCDNSWTFPRPEKPAIAELFYENLSEKTLRAAANFFRTGKALIPVFEGILHEIRKVSSSIPATKLLTGARPHLNELSSVVASVTQKNDEIGVAKGVAQSPNFFSYCDLINKTENFYRRRRKTVEVVFDSAPQFNRSFANYFERLKSARPTIVHFPGKERFVLGYKAIQKFATGSSEDIVLLQCCDLLATGVAQAVQEAGSGKFSGDETGRAMLSLPIELLRSEGRFCSWFASQRLTSRVGRALRQAGA